MTLPKNYLKKSSAELLRTGTTKKEVVNRGRTGMNGYNPKTNKVLEELIKLSNWKPNLTLISRKTGVPISTIKDIFVREELSIRKEVFK